MAVQPTSEAVLTAAELDPQFFRHESGRMVVALTRLFGIHNLALAEDVVQDAFCRAIELWKFRGVPPNPSAWLMTTAKNRALDILRRERTARTYAPELTRFLESEWTLAPTVHEVFAAHSIPDDELRMMFSCCHPRLPENAQVALILNILSGFSTGEIAAAFLNSRAATEKRIARGKKTLADLTTRLTAVHRAIYLLFNEGYHSASEETPIRTELCREAMRLAALLLAHPLAATPTTHALAALMCLHAARLPGRIDPVGNLTPLLEQDRARWDQALIREGCRLLEEAAVGNELTEYHVEAAIAAVHAQAASADATDWRAIIALYDILLAIRPSPVVALNRAIAVAQHAGPARGLAEIATIPQRDRLATYPFYFATLGELERRSGHPAAARRHLNSALKLARNPAERSFLKHRLQTCEEA